MLTFLCLNASLIVPIQLQIQLIKCPSHLPLALVFDRHIILVSTPVREIISMQEQNKRKLLTACSECVAAEILVELTLNRTLVTAA